MEENEVLVPDADVELKNQQDPFEAGWGDDTPDGEDSADPQDTPEQDTDEGAPAPEDDPAPAEAEEHGETPAEPADEPPPSVQQWEVTHLGEKRILSANDITPELLQKGLDYDRVSQKYDATKPVMAVIADMARRSNMNVEEYVRYVRTEAKKSEGMNEAEAKRAVELEDREIAVAAKEETAAKAASVREADEARIKSDLASFARAFPDAYEKATSDPKSIPESVWDAVNAGMPLVAAYAKYAVDQAREETKAAAERVKAAEQNRANAERTTGSMKSAGSDAKNKDPFLDGWGD